ncbi:MAG: hypothetical protein ACFHX7_22905 [Pseudomonadota bacterium]
MEPTELISAVAAAIRDNLPLPPFPKDLTLTEAYGIQAEVVKLVSTNVPGGIKAGVTNRRAQAGLGLDHALLGQLYTQGEHAPGAVIRALPKLAIECEIGITLGADGTPVAAGPAIELVRPDFSRPEDITASNLVASNLAANQFIKGRQQPWWENPADYDAVAIHLTRDGELVASATLRDSLDGPVSALDWMIPQANMLGHNLSNAYLMTGTCGKVVPATPGHYIADYGLLGSLEFTIQ